MANPPVDSVQLDATLNGRSILELASRITIAEDMNSTFPRSAIEIGRDSRYEMQEALAGNPINISVRPTNGPALDVKNVVFSAKPGMHSSAKGLTGMISGVSEDFSKAISKRVTKGWKQKNVDSIIKEIHQEMGSKVPIEVTSGMKQASFTSPSLMPMQALTKAHGLSGLGSKAFYFHTNENGGKAHCKTMKDLASKGPKRSFQYKGNGSSDPASLYDTNIIFDLQYEGSPVTAQKQTEVQGQRYNPSYGQVKQNDKASQGLSTPGLGVQSAKAEAAFPTVNTIEQDKEKRHVDRDKQDLNQYTAKIKLLVPIATDLHVGDVIEVKSGSATYFSDASPENAASGKWMIVSLVHSIDTGGKEGSPSHTGRTVLHCVGKI